MRSSPTRRTFKCEEQVARERFGARWRVKPEGHTRDLFLDKAALLKAIKEAEAKAAKDLEEAQAKKQQALAAAQAEGEKIRRDGTSAVDAQVVEQIAAAQRRIDQEKAEKLTAGRVQIRRKREAAEARVPQVADFLVRELEQAVKSGLR
jgi:vacuolar-type H+-ATPase subunit H